jgi:hypothetical protein
MAERVTDIGELLLGEVGRMLTVAATWALGAFLQGCSAASERNTGGPVDATLLCLGDGEFKSAADRVQLDREYGLHKLKRVWTPIACARASTTVS